MVLHIVYKKLFLKETNRPRLALDFGLIGKGKSNPRQYGTKKTTSRYLSRTTPKSLVRTWEPGC